MQLRDYQKSLILEVQKAWLQGSRKVVIQLSTGGGKTIIFAAIASEFVARGESVLVIAHREELILQASEKLKSATGIEPGIIKAGYNYSESLIQVASIQTLARRKNYPSANLVIIDESHHATSKTYRDLIEVYPESLILGVTATPRREDGYGLRDIFDELICSISTKELIAQKYLTTYSLIAGFKFSKHKVPKNRDFTKNELEQAAKDYKPEEVVKKWLEFSPNKKTIIFAVNVAHSKAITAQFQNADIRCEHIDGTTPSELRKEVLNRFRSGETQIISNCAILTEGFDCPDSESAIIARPTTSTTLWLQMIGRVLRPSLGKEKAIIIDMTDNWARLGRPSDDRVWSLDPVSCDPDTIGTQCCSSCHHVFKPMESLVEITNYIDKTTGLIFVIHKTTCPNCGKETKWIPGTDKQESSEGGKDIEDTSNINIEWLEVPENIRLDIYSDLIIKAKKIRSKRPEVLFNKKLEALQKWFLGTDHVTLAEINFAAKLLEMRNDSRQQIQVSDFMYPLKRKLLQCANYEAVIRLMSNRSREVKEAIWKRISPTEQAKFKAWKRDYDAQLKEWEQENQALANAID